MLYSFFTKYYTKFINYQGTYYIISVKKKWDIFQIKQMLSIGRCEITFAQKKIYETTLFVEIRNSKYKE